MVVRYDSRTARIVGRILLRSEIFSIWFYRSKYVTRLRINNTKSLANDFGVSIVEKQGGAYVVLPFGRLYLDLSSAHDRIMYEEIATKGYYETGTTLFSKKIIREGQSALDIGANNGYYSLLFSHLVGNTGKVYSFEPQEQAFNRLLRNLDENHIKNVFTYQLALGDSDGELDLHISGIEDGESSFVPIEISSATKKVRVTTLDSFIGKIGADIIKIDVEGWENSVIKGGRDFLSKNRPVIILEYNLRLQIMAGFRPRDLLDLLTGIDYNIFEIKDDGTLSKKVNRTSDLSSPLVNLFCIPSEKDEFPALRK